MSFDKEEIGLLRHGTPAQIYAALIVEQKRRSKLSTETLAGEFGIYEEKLWRLKAGKIGPDWQSLRKLATGGANQRLLAGIGFMDVFLRKLGLDEGVVCAEILRATGVFLPAHRRALEIYREAWLANSVYSSQSAGTDQFAKYAASADNLLLHPGFETVWPEMPDALWRAHLYTLQFARTVDLAQAYFQFAGPENNRDLTRFFDMAERKSDSCPHG